MQKSAPELSVRLPEIGESYALPPKKPAKRIRTGKEELQQAVGRDWQNSYANFATGLKSNLSRIRDERRREKAIEDMQRVLESYTDHMESRHGRAKH